MNKKQKAALIVGGVIMIIMMFFPPWLFVNVLGGGATFATDAGYSVIFEPPYTGGRKVGVLVNTGLLVMQLAVTSVLTGIGVLLLKEPKAC